MNASRLIPSPFLLALLALVLLTSCGHHHSSGGHHGPPVFGELEPNGSAGSADFIGVLRPNSHLIIEGHVDAFGPDLLDGFAFVTEQPMAVEFVLYGDAPLADMDLCVYDPVLDDFDGPGDGMVECYDSPFDPEEGVFDVFEGSKEFHLVVEAFTVGSYYSLEIIGRPLGWIGSGASNAESSAEPDASAPSTLVPRTRPAPADKPARDRRSYGQPDVAQAADSEERAVQSGLVLGLDADGSVIELMPWVATDRGRVVAAPRAVGPDE